jgi:LPXTG-site transpeptidase (sortase) family protein
MILVSLLAVMPSHSASAQQALLEITPITWDVLGIDGSNPNLGPSLYPVGSRVCNIGDTPAVNVTVDLEFTITNGNINPASALRQTLPALSQSDCQDFFFSVSVSQSISAIGQSAQFQIIASADGLSPVTSSARTLYVESLVAQPNPSLTNLTGPSVVVVGNTYQYVIGGSISIPDMQQVEHFVNFPPDIFQVESITVLYGVATDPQKLTNDKVYTDACGWLTNTRQCSDPNQSVGGTLSIIYRVKILKNGFATLNYSIYGYQASTNQFNYQQGLTTPLSVVAVPATQTPTVTFTPTLTQSPTPTGPTPTVTNTATITPTPTVTPSPTITGTITPIINLVKSVNPTQAQVSQFFTFTIQVSNTGNGSVTNAVLTDPFPTVLTVTAVNTSRGQGSINSTTRTVTVNIGTMDPGTSATITILAQVNNTATTTVDLTNTATMTYTFSGTTLSKSSNSVLYRVLGSSTLPGTGGMPAQTTASPIPILILLVGILITLGGIGLVSYALWARSKNSAWGTFFLRTGMILIGAGLVFGLFAWALQPRTAPVDQLGAANPNQTPVPGALETQLAGDNPYQDYLPTPTPLSLPDYPIPTPTIAGSAENSQEPDTSAVERILIPALGLDTVVKYVPFDGFTWMIGGLRQEVAWMGNTSWPGLGANTGLAGHVTLADGSDGPFRYLSDLKAGDIVTLYTEKNIYTYQVREQKVSAVSDFSVISPSETAQVTLITCVNWSDELKLYKDRLIVSADLLKVEPIAQNALQGN